MSHRSRSLLLLSTLLLASACSQGVSGLYTDMTGVTQYEFRDDGKVYISVFGATVSGRYEVESDRVLITTPQGTVVLLRKDGRLEGPMGLELARVENE
jgi:hypothetical protein